ncbi:MarR family winged helix-turn-helix transcriptional regulator [Helicovermis profundi]|uniref:HTH marR-type domain-containing protein n=1 Tax=Helicovermis profundi TaxID=3065157 RepID=A0AAU9EB66_9FIRM|nr:hypothetical protein HLPR_23830 [Clostridia bacterium S502]
MQAQLYNKEVSTINNNSININELEKKIKNQENYHFIKEISVISRYSHIYLKNNLKGYDLGSGQFMHLMVLYRNPNINQDTLSKIINIDKGTTAKVVKKLLENGYITRIPSENDKRSYNLNLTEKALKLKKETSKIKKNWNSIILNNISQNDFEIFIKTLNTISENAIKYHEENRCEHGK